MYTSCCKCTLNNLSSFVCIYIQELSIHVYKRVYILLRDGRFPMPCPCKRVLHLFRGAETNITIPPAHAGEDSTANTRRSQKHDNIFWNVFWFSRDKLRSGSKCRPHPPTPAAPVPVGGQRVSRVGPTKTQWNNLGLNFAKFLSMTGFTCRQYCCLHGYRMHVRCGDVWEHFHQWYKGSPMRSVAVAKRYENAVVQLH